MMNIIVDLIYKFTCLAILYKFAVFIYRCLTANAKEWSRIVTNKKKEHKTDNKIKTEYKKNDITRNVFIQHNNNNRSKYSNLASNNSDLNNIHSKAKNSDIDIHRNGNSNIIDSSVIIVNPNDSSCNINAINISHSKANKHVSNDNDRENFINSNKSKISMPYDYTSKFDKIDNGNQNNEYIKANSVDNSVNLGRENILQTIAVHPNNRIIHNNRDINDHNKKVNNRISCNENNKVNLNRNNKIHYTDNNISTKKLIIKKSSKAVL